MNEIPKVTVHHIVSPDTTQKLDAYEVRVGGVKVWRTGFTRNHSAQAEYAKSGAHNYARSLRRALEIYAPAAKQKRTEELAKELLPAIIVKRALAHHTSEAEGAAGDMISTVFEEAFLYAENFFEQVETERAMAKDEAASEAQPPAVVSQ